MLLQYQAGRRTVRRRPRPWQEQQQQQYDDGTIKDTIYEYDYRKLPVAVALLLQEQEVSDTGTTM